MSAAVLTQALEEFRPVVGRGRCHNERIYAASSTARQTQVAYLLVTTGLYVDHGRFARQSRPRQEQRLSALASPGLLREIDAEDITARRQVFELEYSAIVRPGWILEWWGI